MALPLSLEELPCTRFKCQKGCCAISMSMRGRDVSRLVFSAWIAQEATKEQSGQ
jgi:hypothetical protein